jgi:lipopolysaccharide export system protein LptA
MLRRARWILLVAILVLATFTTRLFLTQRQAMRAARPKLSAALPSNTTAAGILFEHEIASGGKTKALVRARNFRQIKEPNVFLLEGLEMEINDETGSSYHLVKSQSAVFDIPQGSMFSEGEAEITMNLPRQGEPARPPLRIRASGMTFDSKTSRVSTGQKAAFEFDGGRGEALGAMYDPNTHELGMHADVRLEWEGRNGGSPMQVEASKLIWRETGDEIYLSAPSKLTRAAFTLEAEKDSIVILKDGGIERLEARQAHGSDRPPGRRIEYQAGFLIVHFTGNSQVSKVEASDPARLVSTNAASATTITGERIDLEFDTSKPESVLRRAQAHGKAQVEARDLKQGAIRYLRSETVEMTMRPGGEEIQEVATHAPGEAEFVPAKPADKRRLVNGERMSFTYGPANALEKVRVVEAVTRTFTPPKPGGKDRKPSVGITRSRDLEAYFDPQTGQMTNLEQWQNFQYEEGPRRAVAERAMLDNQREIITLRDQARIWDETGSTSAKEIVLEQATGNMIALGDVNSTRLPEKRQSAAGMLSPGEATQAKAGRMSVSDDSRKILYEEQAVLWQGARRIEGRTIIIDRAAQTLEARGNVVTQMPEQAPKTAFTVVRADSLHYSDKTKQAFYRGGPQGKVALERPALNVSSRTLRAWFTTVPKKGGGEETQLDRMLCEGDVRMSGNRNGRSRNGEAETAEYYPSEERLELYGGNPMVNDSARGISRGARITWLAREDRLIVDNTGSGLAVSRIKDNKKK